MHIFTNWAEILHIFQYVLFIFSDFRLTSTIELIRMYAIAKDDSNKCSNLFLRKKMNLAAKKRENLYIWALNHENLYKHRVWCEGKKNWLCSTPLSFENEKWHGQTTLSPKLVDLRQGPGVKEGCSVIMMLLVFSPTFHFSGAVQLWCVILFCFWSCEIMWCWKLEQCLWEVIRMHRERQSGCKWQMQKVPFFYKLPNQKAERTLCHACPFTLAPLISHNSILTF